MEEDIIHQRRGSRATAATRRPSPSSASSLETLVKHDDSLERERALLAGLTVAGVATSMLMSVYFQIHSPSTPHYTLLKTLFCLIGGCWIDANSQRLTEFVGLAGCLLAVSTYFPMAFHCLLPITLMLFAVPVTANHRMTETARINFMASGMGANLFALATVRVIHKYTDLHPIVVIILCVILYVRAQTMITGSTATTLTTIRTLVPKRIKEHNDDAEDDFRPAKRTVQWRSAIQKLLTSRTFQAWLALAALHEAQYSFYVTRLVLLLENSEAAVWMLPLILPVRQFVAIVIAYLPIHMFGYQRVHRAYCCTVVTLGVAVLLFGDAAEPSLLVDALLLAYPIVVKALRAAMFPLAMADITMEIQHRHALDGRMDEPPIAGLLMGATALLSKPIATLCSVAASSLNNDPYSRQTTFYMLATIPVLCSLLQLLSWRRYDLTSKQSTVVRDDLHRLLDNITRSASV